MGLFDNDFFDPFGGAKELADEVKRAVREKVDEKIHPDSDLGGVIRKARKFVDREEEKENNRKKAPRNVTYMGQKKEKFRTADHLFVRVGPITHHAIFVGGDRVIHYSTRPDGELHVQLASLEEFSEGKEIRCLSEEESPLNYSRQEAVDRAYHRLGESRYGPFSNNCEAFVRWCRSGGKEEVWEDD